jgi:hypothetical protein
LARHKLNGKIDNSDFRPTPPSPSTSILKFAHEEEKYAIFFFLTSNEEIHHYGRTTT